VVLTPRVQKGSAGVAGNRTKKVCTLGRRASRREARTQRSGSGPRVAQAAGYGFDLALQGGTMKSMKVMKEMEGGNLASS